MVVMLSDNTKINQIHVVVYSTEWVADTNNKNYCRLHVVYKPWVTNVIVCSIRLILLFTGV